VLASDSFLGDEVELLAARGLAGNRVFPQRHVAAKSVISSAMSLRSTNRATSMARTAGLERGHFELSNLLPEDLDV